MGAMGADAHLVLLEKLVVHHTLPRLVARVLQADATELARAVIEHHRVASGLKIHARQHGVVGPVIDGTAVESVVAQADTPIRPELIHSLQIPAGLRRIERRRAGGAEGLACVVRDLALFVAPQVFRLQLEIGVDRIAVGRVFPDEVGDPGAAVAIEAVEHVIICEIDIGKLAVAWRSGEHRHAPIPNTTRTQPENTTPQKSTTPTTMMSSVGASYFSCTPSSPNCMPSR